MDMEVMNYPIYIPTKGRWDRQHTLRMLRQHLSEHLLIILVVEQEEVPSMYNSGESKGCEVLILPESGLGFVYAADKMRKAAQEAGFKYYWYMDDDIHRFRAKHSDGSVPDCGLMPMHAAEEICNDDRPRFIGFQYASMMRQWKSVNPIVRNRMVFNCGLWSTAEPVAYDMDFIHRADLDLLLQAMTAGWDNLKFRNYGYDVGAKMEPGGMYDFYKEFDMSDDIAKIRKKHPWFWDHNDNFDWRYSETLVRS